VNFSSREDDHAILIYKLEPTTGMLRTRAYIGQHMPLYCSAMGKIYMAFGHPIMWRATGKPSGRFSR
jgi:DNA-binding IclR family transcriptional regulator